MKLIGAQLSAGRWIKQNSAKTSGWKFSDEEGGEWRGAVEVRPAGAKVFNLSLKVERVGASAAKPANGAGKAEKFVPASNTLTAPR